MSFYHLSIFILFVVTSLSAGCHSNANGKAAELNSTDPCAIALAAQNQGESKGIDREIARIQQTARKASDPTPYLEQIAWKYVEKARLTYDPGYYKIAEQCAACIDSRKPQSTQAMLLRGHILHNLHRFKEAEEVSRTLVSRRGLAFDYGLLGDVLMEQGKLSEAIPAYQKMMDLKPGPQAYNRGAHLRWLKGDLDGSRFLLQMAAQAAGQGDPESAAWAYARLSLIELQAGSLKQAASSCEAALNLNQDNAPGLLACGRIKLAEKRESEAIALFQRAAKLNPLPEYLWMLADALRASKREAEAREVDEQIISRGESDDPRTLALFLATRGLDANKALKLAENEQKSRSDIYTFDAIAWALAAAGRFDEAHGMIERALAEGTKDARLFFHAAVIAAKSQRSSEAHRRARQAGALSQMLLPSEQEQLRRLNL
ncbi:MAG: tetratricopeptide repeat protein [Acidobacteria bacterium]|nr:tetratricopeptide repeat protein [Acidobacteriota bacterium]